MCFPIHAYKSYNALAGTAQYGTVYISSDTPKDRREQDRMPRLRPVIACPAMQCGFPTRTVQYAGRLTVHNLEI